MKTYQYQLIRYVHDQFTGEFLNMGVVVYSSEDRQIDCVTSRKYQRLTGCFPPANGKWTLRILRHIESRIKDLNRSGKLFELSNELSAITSQILPRDNSTIQLTEVQFLLDIDLKAAMEGVFKSLVEKYYPEAHSKITLTDDEVWKVKYKQYFDQYKISTRLVKHDVSTNTDVFTFEKAWKNEIWHCYEPVSFALTSKESIKDKVYRWAGKIKGMQEANERVHLTLLTSLNSKYAGMNEFIQSYLKSENQNLEVEIKQDNQAESVAKEIKRLMEMHDKEN